jgi:hypothetical protein
LKDKVEKIAEDYQNLNEKYDFSRLKRKQLLEKLARLPKQGQQPVGYFKYKGQRFMSIMDHLVREENKNDPQSLIKNSFMKLADLEPSSLVFKEKKQDLSKSLVCNGYSKIVPKRRSYSATR